jgi:hypothetical protein
MWQIICSIIIVVSFTNATRNNPIPLCSPNPPVSKCCWRGYPNLCISYQLVVRTCAFWLTSLRVFRPLLQFHHHHRLLLFQSHHLYHFLRNLMEENLRKYHKPRASKGAPIPLEPPCQSLRPGTLWTRECVATELSTV